MKCERVAINVSMREMSTTQRVLAALTHFSLKEPIPPSDIAHKASYNGEIYASGVRRIFERSNPDCASIDGDNLTIYSDPRNDEINVNDTATPPTCNGCYFSRSNTSPCPILADTNKQRNIAYNASKPI